jgi:hypothetical protein
MAKIPKAFNSDGGGSFAGGGRAGAGSADTGSGIGRATGKTSGGGGGMPSSIVTGGARTGTFHGKHDVAHPITGGSSTQDIQL